MAHDFRRADGVCVVDVEAPARRVVRREREPEKALLGAGGEGGGREERGAQDVSVLENLDPAAVVYPALLDDEDSSRVSGRRRDEEREAEALRDDVKGALSDVEDSLRLKPNYESTLADQQAAEAGGP